MNKPDNKLSYLLVAGASLVFFTTVLPILDSASSWVQNKFNYHNALLQDRLQKEIEVDICERARPAGFRCESDFEE